jgi:hypothetical protein
VIYGPAVPSVETRNGFLIVTSVIVLALFDEAGEAISTGINLRPMPGQLLPSGIIMRAMLD